MGRILKGTLLGAWVAGLLWWECRSSLRSVSDSKVRRDVRNLVVASFAGAATSLLEAPVATAVARRAQEQSSGLLQWLRIPERVKPVAAVLLLDYTLYVWHWLTHRAPLLWRFHMVHHVDREMDASTAVRFHFGEITISVAYRAFQMWLIGPTPSVYTAWQTFLLLCILFHHANVRIPLAWERRLAFLFVTPRLHGIHHSVIDEEVNSNWSSGLTIWDRLHGTLRTDMVQDSLVIGVDGLRGDRDQELGRVLAMPFEEGEVR